MKKFFIIMMLFCMIVTALTSCNGGTSNAGKDTDKPESEITTQDPESLLFPNKDMGGKEINILMSTEMQQYCYAEEYGVNVVSDAVYKSYLSAKEKYNVNFFMDYESSQGKNTARFNLKIQNGVSAGDEGYDLIMGQMHSIGLALNGCYRNLAKTEYLNLDADYYYQSINNSATIAGQLYAVAGAYNMDKVSMSIVCFFNKSIHEDVFYGTEYENLYDLVEGKKWTYEALNQMTLAAKSENGDGEWNEKDRYGLIGVGTGVAALVGSGVVAVTKNDDNYSLSFYNEHLTTVYNSYSNLFANEYIKVDGTYDEEVIFTSGNALFYSSHVNRLGVMNSGVSFEIGVLPFPMYNETQGEYRTHVNRSEMIFVPMNADLETSCTIIEYMNYLFLKDVVPAYWDQSMTSRYAADLVDAEMLELARACVFEDFGITYTSMLDYFYAAAGENLMTGEELTSWWRGIEETTGAKLKALVTNYKELATLNY